MHRHTLFHFGKLTFKRRLSISIDVDELLGQDAEETGYMCRVCFSAFERLATLVYNLDSNLSHAIDAICSGECLPKSKRMKTTSTRAKLTTSLTGDLIAASLLEGVQNSNKSPCVQVSW